MTRLIDADALKDWSEIVPLTCDGGIDINDFDEKLKSMPTVDAIPVEDIENEIDVLESTAISSADVGNVVNASLRALALRLFLKKWYEENG